MDINKLPDDCLLYIFSFFITFDTLLNCSKVCERWKCLVLERLRNVKYITDSDTTVGDPVGNNMIFKKNFPLEKYELSKWFPNLKILTAIGNRDVKFVANARVKGLILENDWEDLDYLDYMDYLEDLDDVPFNNPSLEMFAGDRCYDFFANEIQGPLMKQLYLRDCNVSEFSGFAEYFPNLKRLHIFKCQAMNGFEDELYTGPVLENLEILEICFEGCSDTQEYHGFSLADQCPALKSAFHFILIGQDPLVNSEIKNYCLEDLVLEFYFLFPDWPVMRRILSKYPNLKHLAIRGLSKISDENIPELLKLLPRITLIDIRRAEKVTEKSAQYIDRYCRQHNRSISFYHQKSPSIAEKWPHLSTKRVSIGRGFDFMKYCFLKYYDDLPYLLDPDE